MSKGTLSGGGRGAGRGGGGCTVKLNCVVTARNPIGLENLINYFSPSNSWKRARTNSDLNYKIGYHTVVTVYLDSLIVVSDTGKLTNVTRSNMGSSASGAIYFGQNERIKIRKRLATLI